MTGQEMYEAYLVAMKRAVKRRALNHEPSWKELKPWLKRVWNEAADELPLPSYEPVELPCPHHVPCISPCQPTLYRRV